MSADASYSILHNHAEGHIILPQPVGDLSLYDSVTGFIQEAYVNVLPSENKIGDRILWAKFVQSEQSPDIDSAHLILALAYSTGIQVWSINAKGEAKEVLSWHQGIVKAFQFLPTPDSYVGCAKDMYLMKRPLVAFCDNGGPAPPYHNVTFLSLSTGEQVKHIKFKNEVNEILASRKCIVVTFNEKIAIFDATTLEDKFSITTCYPSKDIKHNPVSLGSRWLAFSDRRLLSLSRSYGGYEGEGTQSYTATVLQAAKSLGKGLRDLSGSVANSLSGNVQHNFDTSSDSLYPGVVTVLDMECKNGDSKKEGSIVAHFVAHTTPIVALTFDPTGLLLLTAEKRGHKFNIFRIEPHKNGSSQARVHHLYILHRGDTTARVQDISFSSDSRWVAVSTLRGTTHVFPITMYGGAIGLRTHTTPHVVNRLSRFHKSAGISSVVDKSSPLKPAEPSSCSSPTSVSLNPTSPIVVVPLAQIRRQLAPSSSSSNPPNQRHLNVEDTSVSVKVSACFSSPKSFNSHWLKEGHGVHKAATNKRVLESLFLITGHGYLIQYDLDPRPIAGLTKDKICDDTAIELYVEPRCQWKLFYPPSSEKLNKVCAELAAAFLPPKKQSGKDSNEKWLSQVEIITHAGPHRRLWMGPQFSFKTYNPPSSEDFSFDDIVGSNVNTMPTRSTPMNIEKSKIVPVLIETVSTGSSDQSPRFMEEIDMWVRSGESQLCEDLADAMQESFVPPPSRRQGVSGSRVVWVTEKQKNQSAQQQEQQQLSPLESAPQVEDEAMMKSEESNYSSLKSEHHYLEDFSSSRNFKEIIATCEDEEIVEASFVKSSGQPDKRSDTYVNTNVAGRKKNRKSKQCEEIEHRETSLEQILVNENEEDLQVEDIVHDYEAETKSFEEEEEDVLQFEEEYIRKDESAAEEEEEECYHYEEDDIVADPYDDPYYDYEDNRISDELLCEDVSPIEEDDVSANYDGGQSNLIPNYVATTPNNSLDVDVDNVLIDNTCGLKKRKNKKKKR